MAPTAKFYAGFYRSLMNKEIDIDSDTFKLMLCTNLYVPDQDAHRYKNHITNEVSAPGYIAGGTTVSPLTIAYDSPTNTLSFSGANGVWPASTITARYAILYDSTPGSDATRPLVGYLDFGADYGSVAATFSVVWPANGMGALVVA
jgi:hypothetical protein